MRLHIMRMETPVSQIVDYSAREQIAALPFRTEKSRTMILLITSRGTGRWVLPKGWVEASDPDPAEAAAREALEEAGVIGEMYKAGVGTYTYFKLLDGGTNILCSVRVYPLRVKRELKNFKEAGQRILEWFSVEDAAEAVKEPELAALIRKYGSELS
jgi:8-oxo-dGTP pyrophosphatase MutT (NUDIX family)